MQTPYILCILTSALFFSTPIQATEIVLNQVGYLPSWSKNAFLVNPDSKIKQAELLSLPDKKIVFKIKFVISQVQKAI